MTGPAPYFAPLRVGAALYDLGHLDPVRFQVPSDKLCRAVTVRCRFSNHVFTRALNLAADPADVPTIMDGVRRRVFCPDRYRLSFHLPGAVLGLREPRIYVRETATRRNWLYVATIELAAPAPDPAGAVGCMPAATVPVRYQVFFALRKASKGGAAREDVEMVVESAYAEDLARPPNLLGRALFAGLATAAVEGRQVHTQPARKR